MQFFSCLTRASLLALCCIFLIPLSALACGGLYAPEGVSIDQDAERMIFAVDKDRTTMYEQINYHGSPEEFAWILPVPAVPKVETASPKIFEMLDRQTRPLFYQRESPPCGWDSRVGLTGAAPNGGNGGEITVYGQGITGPYAYDIIKSDKSDALVQWLKDHRYHIPDQTQTQIQPYVDEHALFLALRLRPGKGTEDIAPIKLTANTTMHPMVSLRMAASTARKNTNILVWIFGQTRYVPQNYQSVEFGSEDFTNITSSVGDYYQQLVDKSVSHANGHAFITEYAQSASVIMGGYASRGDNDYDALAKYDYVTRLYTRISPEQMTIDPMFVPQQDKPHVVNNIHGFSRPNTCDPFNSWLGSVSRGLSPLIYMAATCYWLPVLIPLAIIVGVIITFSRRRRKKQQNNQAPGA